MRRERKIFSNFLTDLSTCTLLHISLSPPQAMHIKTISFTCTRIKISTFHINAFHTVPEAFPGSNIGNLAVRK